MDDLNVVDRFTETFLTFIDSGFGLLGPDIGFLIRILVTVDIVLAGLAWALTTEGDVFAGLLRKVLYVGAFALILNNYALLADIIFSSFVDLGLTASAAPIRPDDLLRPGFVANTGVAAAHPILLDIQTLIGFPEIVVNAVEIAILLLAWLGVVAAFFVLAVQMFVTLVEFKLMALAGFVLVPFALWSRTTFLAERVLGNVMASGVKVMVLAVVIGIGSTIFADVASALQGQEVTIARAMPLLLAAFALLGIGIHGPAVASGLIAGGPQLDAGAATGTARRARDFVAGALRVLDTDDDRRHRLVLEHRAVGVLDVDVGVGQHARGPFERSRVVGKLHEEDVAPPDGVLPLLEDPRGVERVVDDHPQRTAGLHRQGEDVHLLVHQALTDPVEGAGAVLQP